jgi:tRNA pseudouridine38-40 synthase
VVFVRNILLTIEYDGTNYHGWQRQKNALSIQQLIEESIENVTGVRTKLIGSGRTDTGVHALGQRANFKTNTNIPTDRIPLALNGHLPLDIRIINAIEVDPEFHARYDVIGKKYRYRIFNRSIPSAVLRNYSCYIPVKLDLDSMKEAAGYIIGRKDFSSFCSSGSLVRSRIRKVQSLELETEGNIIDMSIIADGFLYNMVRIIAGTLVEVGKGNMAPGDVKALLEKRDRKRAGPTLPPQGLFLEEVYYRGILDTPGTM